jgi:hypothetical protein
MNTLLLIAASCFLCYFVPAVIFWESLFHRVWSLALLCLPLSIIALYHPPLSDYTLPILIFTILDFMLSVALSPVQIILYPREDDGTDPSALKIINDEAVQTKIYAEFVPPSLVYSCSLPRLIRVLAFSIIVVHGLASKLGTAWDSCKHAQDTDTTPAPKLMWLYDFLPKEKLNARILLFNHNTRWQTNAVSKSLKDYGKDLLRALRRVRQTPEV